MIQYLGLQEEAKLKEDSGLGITTALDIEIFKCSLTFKCPYGILDILASDQRSELLSNPLAMDKHSSRWSTQRILTKAGFGC